MVEKPAKRSLSNFNSAAFARCRNARHRLFQHLWIAATASRVGLTSHYGGKAVARVSTEQARGEGRVCVKCHAKASATGQDLVFHLPQ